MKKKNYAENSEEDNEFDVDEPEEIQNNASDDDWTPDKDTSGGRRTSSRLRNFPPRARAPIIDASSTEEEGSDEDSGSKRKSKGKGRGRTPVKKQKVSSTSTPPVQRKSNNVSRTASSDSEPSSTTTTAPTTKSTSVSPSPNKVSKDFTSGAFIVLKTDVEKESEDPPLWKIDGKALLQKYIAFEQDGKTLYKNTSVYSGWTINNKNNYYPITVIFKQQTRKEHIVEFNRDQIKKKEPGEKVADNGNDNEKDDKVDDGEKDKADCGEKDIKKEISETESNKDDVSGEQDSCKIICSDIKVEEKDNDKDEDSKDDEGGEEEKD